MDNLTSTEAPTEVKPIILKDSGVPAHQLTPEDSVKGGRQSTFKKKVANAIRNNKTRKCRNCHYPCPYKEHNLKKNPKSAAICTVSPSFIETMLLFERDEAFWTDFTKDYFHLKRLTYQKNDVNASCKLLLLCLKAYKQRFGRKRLKSF